MCLINPLTRCTFTNRSSRLEPACLYPLHAGVGLTYTLQGLGKGKAGEPWAARHCRCMALVNKDKTKITHSSCAAVLPARHESPCAALHGPVNSILPGAKESS